MTDCRICLLEDDETERELLTNILFEYDNIEDYSDADEFLASVSPSKPVVLITETALANGSGYEVCKRLKSEYSHCITSVLFLSSQTSLEEQLQGLEAGADDYINKPYDIEQLTGKIRAAVLRVQNSAQLQAQLSMASSTAFEAMTAQGEMGTVLQAVQSFNDGDDHASASKAVFDCLNQFGLASTLYMSQHGEEVFLPSPNRQVSELERKIIATIRPKHRIWSKDRRSMYNFENSSLLILNMPEDDTKAGRYRDILCLLMEPFDSRVKALNDQKKLVDAENWQKSVKDITKLLTKASIELQQSVDQSSNLFGKMLSDLDLMLPGMGLEEDQEKRIFATVDEAREDFKVSEEATTYAQDVFKKVITQLHKMQQ